MDLFDILSTEVIAGIIIAATLIMGVRSMLMFSRQAAQMAPKLQKLESNLSRIQDSMVIRKKSVKDLTVVVDPLREQEGRIREYHEKLKNMELTHERESADQEEKDEAAKRKRIQRKKHGLRLTTLLPQTIEARRCTTQQSIPLADACPRG